MFDTILGLPVHPLVVHAVVVLVPLAAAGVLLMAVSRLWFERLRWPVLGVLTVGLGSAFVAKQSGEAFLSRLRVTGDQVQRHVDLGNVAPILVGLFWVVCVLWVAYAARVGRPRSGVTPPGVRAMAALAVLAGLAVTVDLVLVGHSGATAVWKDIVDSTTTVP